MSEEKPIIRVDGAVKTVDQNLINQLKTLAGSSSDLRSRVLIHNSSESPIHEMIIVLHKDSIVEPHRHPMGKSESYLILEGHLRINTWEDANSNPISHEILPYDAGNSSAFFWNHSNGLWHQPQSLTDWSVYLEVYEGPFCKEIDVEFMRPKQL